MEFTDAAKQTILDLLQRGERDAALQYLSRIYYVSPDEARKLLDAFEQQYVERPAISFDAPQQEVTSSLPGGPQAPPPLSGCRGCLSGALTAISILLMIVGLGLLGVAYFGIEFAKEELTKREVTLTVTGSMPNPDDSASVQLIYKRKLMGFSFIDTTSATYPEGKYQAGDTINLAVNRSPKEDLDTKLDEFRNYLMIPGIVFVVMAIMLWLGSRALKPARVEQNLRR